MLTPSVGGIKFFQFNQTTPSATWNIYHAFGHNPLVDLNVIEGGQVMKAFPLSVVYVDENNVQVNWSAPRIGYASIASTQL
jgi:hypothetical protein